MSKDDPKKYIPDNMLVTVSGNVTSHEVLELARKYFGDLGSKVTPRVYKNSIKDFTEIQTKSKVLLDSQKREQANLILGFLGNKRGADDRYIEAIMATILGSGMSSRLFQEVREKRGLAYSNGQMWNII